MPAQKPESSWGRRGTAGTTIARKMHFENITHRFGNNLAINDVNLEIEPGEIVCLLGHSGSGKTTLLRMAAGVERPKNGRFLVDDMVYSGPGTFVPPEKRGIGLMFQDFALFPHLSVLKNVMFGLSAQTAKNAKSEALLALGRVGLADYADFYPHHLSGGEQQRVALARAIAPRPGILLMDEPFSGLDQRLRDSVRDETITVLREMRSTCLMVTHDPEEAMRVADRILLMRQGQIVQDGTPSELYLNPADLAAARFFSEINQIEGQITNNHVSTPVGHFAAEYAKDGPADVCIRYQGVHVTKADSDTELNSSNSVRGRILGRRFLGEVKLLELAVEGLDDLIHARVRSSDEMAPGTEVDVNFEPRDILVFEKVGG